MFNGRYPEEEGTHVRRTFKAWILREKANVPPAVYSDVAIDESPEDAPVIFRRDGGLARVPKHDSVPVVDNRRMIVPIDPITLEPLDEEERRRGHPAASESGDEENNTTVVYIPPRFRLRIILFLLLMWLSGSLLTCSITVVPLLLGRHIFEQFIKPGAQVQDMYAFILGAYIMTFLSLVINWVGHKFDALTRAGGRIDFAQVRAYVLQRGQKVIYCTLHRMKKYIFDHLKYYLDFQGRLLWCHVWSSYPFVTRYRYGIICIYASAIIQVG